MGDRLARACAAAGAALRTEERPGDIGDLVKMHGSLYAREHGFSMEFEAYVAGTFAGYAWPLGQRQRLWIIERGGTAAGSIAIVAASPTQAQLRWLLLAPEVRGRGLGSLLVEEAVEFSRSSGYSSLVLWTVSSLTTATALYRRAGFQLTEQKTHVLWGAERTEERYDLGLTEGKG